MALSIRCSTRRPVFLSALLLMTTIVLLVLPNVCLVDAEASVLSGPPERPASFKNAEELRDYLKALNDYFSIVGRPRFGRKRSSYSDLRLLPFTELED